MGLIAVAHCLTSFAMDSGDDERDDDWEVVSDTTDGDDPNGLRDENDLGPTPLPPPFCMRITKFWTAVAKQCPARPKPMAKALG